MKVAKRPRERVLSLVVTLVTALTLVACGTTAQDATGSSDDAASTSGGASTSVVASTYMSDTEGLDGKPWVTSIIQGNLPAEQPALTDDLFTHYTYDYLSAHQQEAGMTMTDCAGELKTVNLAVIKDESKTSHDLEQLRIFFDQASDTERLKETGLSEIQGYLDRIDAVTSIGEMNSLIVADDFPFSPFILASLALTDTRDVNVVEVQPDLVLVDTVQVGGLYYQDTEDEQTLQMQLNAIANSAALTIVDLQEIGMDSEGAAAAYAEILDFERAHGKYVDYSGKYNREDFGAMAEQRRDGVLTLAELCTACPGFPMMRVLEKLGKASSPTYIASRDWLGAFADLWNDEHLNAIKLVAKASILKETRPYRDPSLVNSIYEQAGQTAPDAETFAYEAANQQSTFAITLAETYVDEAIGDQGKERLMQLSRDLIDTYKDLVATTDWVSEASRERIEEKLDNMTLNVLEPQGGYYDFSGLELTPTDEGGTLFGNYLKLKQYRMVQERQMVGQPATPACSWYLLKPTELNCTYDLTSNSININPGYVTSLVYTDGMDEQDLLAGLGFVIGHEISHGFDYQGGQFDAYGAPETVYADADVDAFVVKTSALASYYGTLEIAPGITVSGENVVTEAAADLCGMQAALQLAAGLEECDYDRFFATQSNMWAEAVSELVLPTLVLDPHPLNNYRVNVNAQMFDVLYDKLGVQEGNVMYLAPEERINLWGENA